MHLVYFFGWKQLCDFSFFLKWLDIFLFKAASCKVAWGETTTKIVQLLKKLCSLKNKNCAAVVTNKFFHCRMPSMNSRCWKTVSHMWRPRWSIWGTSWRLQTIAVWGPLRHRVSWRSSESLSTKPSPHCLSSLIQPGWRPLCFLMPSEYMHMFWCVSQALRLNELHF